MRNLLILMFILFYQNQVLGQDNPNLKKQLSEMNNIHMASFRDTTSSNNGKLFKVLIVGNSIANHGVAKKIGWLYQNGMAASNIGNDYAHLLFKEIINLMPKNKISMRVANNAGFERNFDNFNLNKVNNLKKYKPDLIVFQLGENVTFDSIKTRNLFEQKYTKFINYIKDKNNPIVICTTPFFPSLEKNIAIKNITKKTNSFKVDLSHLVLLDKKNYAKNELDYQGDKTTWKANGIGIHPGDYGMQNIASEIMVVINAVINFRNKT
jgi:hypothetical protein